MKNKLDKGQLSCLLVAILIVVFLGYQGYIRLAPELFTKKENLEVQQWLNYNSPKWVLPLFQLQYPKGWKIKTTHPCNFSLVCTYIHSPWNNKYSPDIPKHNPNKDYAAISIEWNNFAQWSKGTDELLGSAGDITNKIENTPENFEEKTVNGYKALFAKEGKTKNNSAYIFTNKEIFKFTLDFKTQNNPQKVKDIYYTIINSFQLIE